MDAHESGILKDLQVFFGNKSVHGKENHLQVVKIF